MLPDAPFTNGRWTDLIADLGTVTEQETVASGDLGDPTVDLVWMGRNFSFFTAENRSYAITAVADNILRFETRAGDHAWTNDESNNYCRSEVSNTERYSKTAVYWWSFSFLVEAGAAMNYPHCMVGQLHGADVTGFPRQPITAMVLAQDRVRFRTQYSTDPQSAGTATHHVPSNDTLSRDVWSNVVIEEKQGTGDGYINVWRDGTQVVNATGINLGYVNDAQGPNFQCGQYRTNDGSTLSVRVANFEFGTTDLSARIASPLSI